MDFNPALLIPIIAILMPVFIVLIVFHFRSKERAETQKTIRMAIEKGQPLPPEYLEGLQKSARPPKAPASDIRTGLILLAIGVAMAIWSYIEHGYLTGFFAGLGVLLGLLGAAFLIMGIIGNNTRKS